MLGRGLIINLWLLGGGYFEGELVRGDEFEASRYLEATLKSNLACFGLDKNFGKILV